MFLHLSAYSADNSPRAYRGCSTSIRRRGTIRTTPVADVVALRRARRAARRDLPSPSQFVNLELEPDALAGVACWSGGPTQWAQVTVSNAYDQRYQHVRDQMSAGIAKRTLVVVAAEMARFADRGTGRSCWPSNATLQDRTGFSKATVQRARRCLRLLGVATEVVRGRQRTYVERMASWRMGDRHRGWTSVWALHDNQQVSQVMHELTPHLARSPLDTIHSPLKRPFTTHTGAKGARQGVASRRRSIDQQGARLARQWRSHPKAPPWSRMYGANAWAAMLAAPARHGWTAEDLTAAVSEWLIGGHRIPRSPQRPIGLMGAILAAYTAHNDLASRPSAYAEAAAKAHEARRADQAQRRAVERQEFALGRTMGRAALDGPGRAECHAVMERLRRARRR